MSAFEDDQLEIDLDDFRDDLDACLPSERKTGSFAHYSNLAQSPNPSLRITDIGTVGLPLSERDAAALKAFSHLAPFGKGTDTIVDESLRKTNSKWQEWVQSTIVPRVVEQLGVESGTVRHTRADFYKLLLYEQGAHFKPHQDSEKAPRMYATLVICLPSEHLGGEVVLRQSSDSRTWQSSQFSISDLSYAAWYADVTHEVRPVSSGHRLVLTYNLIDESPTPGSLQSAALMGASGARLERILERWKIGRLYAEEGDKIDFITYIIEHEYTEASLCFSNLKGHDKQIAALAARVGQKVGFRVCLATLEKMRSGACDEDDEYGPHEIFDDIDSHLILESVVDVEGTPIVEKVHLKEEAVAPRDYFKTADADDKEFDGHTGNEGATTTLWYRKTAIVLVPNANYNRLLINPILENASHVRPLGQQLQEAVRKEPDSDEAKRELTIFCFSILWKAEDLARQQQTHRYTFYSSDDKKFSDDDIGYVLVCCLSLGDIDLAQKAVKVLAKGLPLALFGDLLTATPMAVFAKVLQDCLPRLLARLGTISSQLVATRNMRTALEHRFENDAHLSTQTLAQFDEWSRSAVEGELASQHFNTPEDAKTLVRLAEVFQQSMLFDHVLPRARRQIVSTPFAVEFLAAIMTHRAQIAAQSRVRLKGLSVTHQTQHSGSPHTLIITKIGNDYQGRLQRWRQRMQKARKVLSSLPEPPLRKILGNDYEVLALQQGTQMPVGPTGNAQPLRETQSKTASGSSTTAPVLGKRKAADADFADLTAE